MGDDIYYEIYRVYVLSAASLVEFGERHCYILSIPLPILFYVEVLSRKFENTVTLFCIM